MSRRTFPRAAAAGLVAAALGTQSPAFAQAPNPWRGETAAVPTAPAPRAVAPKPTRQLVIGVSFNSVGGVTGSIQVRDLAAVPVAPQARVVTAKTTDCPCPAATATATAAEPNVVRKPDAIANVVAAQAVLSKPEVARIDSIPRETVGVVNRGTVVSFRMVPVEVSPAPAPVVVPAAYSAPVTVARPMIMPPPAPLPVQVVVPASATEPGDAAPAQIHCPVKKKILVRMALSEVPTVPSAQE